MNSNNLMGLAMTEIAEYFAIVNPAGAMIPCTVRDQERLAWDSCLGCWSYQEIAAAKSKGFRVIRVRVEEIE